MKARKIIALTVSVLMLSACGTPPPKPAPQAATPPPPKLNLDDSAAVAGASIVQRDEYMKTTLYTGPNIAEKNKDQLFIRAKKSDIGGVTYQIYVKINYSGVWRFYNQAYDAKGNALYTTLLSRNLAQCQNNDCSHNEQVSIEVTRMHLEDNMQGGLRFKVRGKAGEEAFFIPSGYIKAFLSLSGESRLGW